MSLPAEIPPKVKYIFLSCYSRVKKSLIDAWSGDICPMQNRKWILMVIQEGKPSLDILILNILYSSFKLFIYKVKDVCEIIISKTIWVSETSQIYV